MRDLLYDALSAAGYDVAAAGSRAEMLRALETRHVDLITLDLVLGAEDGLRIAADVRQTVNIPIIMITGRADAVDRVTGLEQGADDYITKPFHVKEVIIRVKSVLDRYARTAAPSVPISGRKRLTTLRFDHHLLDSQRRQLVSADGSAVSLTETECDILAMFLENPGRILSRDEIWSVLRGHERDPLDRTLDGHIAHLRRKIDEAGCEDLRITSVRGVGYVFVNDAEAATAS